MQISIKEAAIKYNVSVETVHSWFKRKGLPRVSSGRTFLIDDDDIQQYVFKKVMVNCDFCGKEFTQKRNGHVCCSKKCREKKWVSDNPERDAELKKKSRFKLNPVICKLCHNKIPDTERTMGKFYCNGCYENRINIKLEKEREVSNNIRKAFREYKESQGCSICGYNKFGGSLDYHHTNSDERERRIDAVSWYMESELCKKEIQKCILVCKNCHYEIHHMKKDI